MKRLFLIGIMALAAVSGFAQDVNRVDKLKEQQKVLDLTSKLNKLQLDLEKEKATYNDLVNKASEVNAEANVVTKEFTFGGPSHLLGLGEAVLYAFATSLGYALAMIIFSGLREHLALNDVPKPFKGIPIALITVGILAMAFMGFSGIA